MPINSFVTSYSYKVTSDGHVQIVATVTQPNGAYSETASAPMTKEQLSFEVASLTLQQTNLPNQISAINSALLDSGLTK